MRKFFRKTEGFTLVELIVVIAILGILAGIGTVGYSGYMKKANEAADNQLLSALNSAFAVACIENGVDANSIADNGVSETWSGKKVTGVSLYNAEFVKYYGDGVNAEFKYFTDLEFEGGVFKGVVGDAREALAQALRTAWEGSNFDKDGMAQTLLATYDTIGGYFQALEGTVNVQGLMSNVSEDLADALGLTGMAEGINNALAAEKIEKYLMASVDGYAEMTDEQKAQWKTDNAETLNIVKGNAAVWGFAEDAAGRTVEEVKGSLNTFISVLGKKDDEAWIDQNINFEYLESYYLSTLSDSQKQWYRDLESQDLRDQALGGFLSEKKSLGDFEMTGYEAAIYAKAAEGLDKDNTGVSGLGSMYAIAAGFFNSEYAPEGGTDQPYSDFGCVLDAVNDPNFQTYYEQQGAADLQAYLDFMNYLSTNPDVDMTDPNAFSGQSGYIADALGGGE